MSLAPSRGVRLEVVAPLLACGLVFAVATWAAEPYPVGIFHDDGVYATLAKALATGEGFRYLNLPGAPVATHYPPVYPLLLALQWKLAPDFPANIPVLQVLNAFALALTAWGVMSFGRKILEWPVSATAAAALVGTLSYPLLGLSGHLLSETLFAAALFPALIVGERSMHSSRADDAWIAGAVAGVLTLVRTHGVALAAALVLVLLLHRQWRRAAFVAGGVVLVLVPWQLFLMAHDDQVTGVLRGKYAGYLPWLLEGLRGGAGFVIATMIANVREVQALLADRFSLSDHMAPRFVTGIAATVVAAGGAVRLWRRAPVTVAFAAFYLVILLLWPYTPWRFLYAVWPVVILCMAAMVQWLLELRPRDAVAAGAGLAVIAALALGVLREEYRAYRDRAWYQPAKRATEAVAPVIRWVGEHTAP
ncbi:MAG: hypothetical protein ACRENU_02860, partial [Gemmatimonadaceae bacterium]